MESIHLQELAMAVNMKSKFFASLWLFIGGISFLAGSYGLYRLYDQAGKMEHTVGVVTHLKTEKIYRHRKQRYKHTARIRYKTKLHDTHIRKELHNPFIFQGSEISLWYNPERPEEVIIPLEDGLVWGSVWIFGVFCLFTGAGIATFKKKHFP